jgi:hypothetical protein
MIFKAGKTRRVWIIGEELAKGEANAELRKKGFSYPRS